MGRYQGDQVPRVFAAKFSAAADSDEWNEEDDIGDVVGPGVLPHKRLDVGLKGEESDGREGDDELHGENQENLPTHTSFNPLYKSP